MEWKYLKDEIPAIGDFINLSTYDEEESYDMIVGKSIEPTISYLGERFVKWRILTMDELKENIIESSKNR
jgi:hypothetical protein